jgi:hypothetical protein
MTEGLFGHFAPLSAGIIYGEWEFGSGAAPSPSPTRTWQAATSVKATPSATSTTLKASTTASTTTSSTPTTSTASTAATGGVIQQAERFMVGLGGIVAAG